MKTLGTIELNKARISLSEDELVTIRIKENADLNEIDIRQINNAKNEMVKGKPYIVIFIAPQVGSISREARELSASHEVCGGAICKAIVANSKIAMVISTFFINFMRPPVPIQVFTNEEKALNWAIKMRSAARRKQEQSV